VVLLARFISVGASVTALRWQRGFSPGTVKILTWAGLRGGISVALALSLPLGPERNSIITVTYVIMVFSILVQGLTVGRLVQRLRPAEPLPLSWNLPARRPPCRPGSTGDDTTPY